jgi:hypothetical protein
MREGKETKELYNSPHRKLCYDSLDFQPEHIHAYRRVCHAKRWPFASFIRS